MNRKSDKSKQKISDITKPGTDAASAGSKKLVINSRPFMVRDKEDAPGSDINTHFEPNGSSKSPTAKKITITPADGDDKEDSKPEQSAGEKVDVKTSKTAEPQSDAANLEDITGPTKAVVPETESAPEPAPEKKTDDKPEEKSEEDKPDEVKTDDEVGTDGESGDEQPTPETRKAVEEAAAAEKREREVESLIESRQFFVPINSVARKRSIKVSLLLTVLVIALSVVLVDLMLDSGVILLVQKIPHTHFFNTNSDFNN